MRARLVVRSTLLATLLAAAAATPALAQSGPPGACDCAVAPAPVVVVAPRPQGWDGRRWSIGLHLSSIGLTDEATDAESEFGGGGLQLRYRPGARWEFELSTDGGREQIDGREGERMIGAGTLAALYHLRPHRRWDVYLLAGIGGTRIYTEEQAEEGGEARGHFALGAGLERHWGRIGVAAELRLLGLGPAEPADEEVTPTRGDTTTMAVVTEEREAEGMSGGRFSIGASYRF